MARHRAVRPPPRGPGGADVLKLGKEGAKLVLDAQINMVTTAAPGIAVLEGKARWAYQAGMFLLNRKFNQADRRMAGPEDRGRAECYL